MCMMWKYRLRIPSNFKHKKNAIMTLGYIMNNILHKQIRKKTLLSNAALQIHKYVVLGLDPIALQSCNRLIKPAGTHNTWHLLISLIWIIF